MKDALEFLTPEERVRLDSEGFFGGRLLSEDERGRLMRYLAERYGIDLADEPGDPKKP